MIPTQMPLPPLNSPLPVDEQARAQWPKPWGNWLTAAWQQFMALFTLTATISTTDGSATVLATITVPPETTMLIEARTVARRTGGSSGTAEDGAGYLTFGTYKNAAGTATEIGETALVTHESQAGWACTMTPTGATVQIIVTGAANNNVDWLTQYRVTQVS